MSEFAGNEATQPGNVDFMSLESVWEGLQRWDESVRRYHLGIGDPALDYFRELICLLGEMIRGIAKPSPGWHPKFAITSKVSLVIALSAAGSLRSLLATYKLLIDGYFLEAHASMRMVEQWAELSVVVEANPRLVDEVLEQGVKASHREAARRKSPDLDRLLKAMAKTFSELSQRGHVTKAAIQLTAPSISDKGMELSLAGNASDKMLSEDGLALAGMALNVLRIFVRHFRKVPSNWHSKFIEAEKLIGERKNLLSSRNC